MGLWTELRDAMDAGDLQFEAARNARIRAMHGHETMADVIAALPGLRQGASGGA